MMWWTCVNWMSRAIDLLFTPSPSMCVLSKAFIDDLPRFHELSTGAVLSREDTGLCGSVASEVYTRRRGGKFARVSRPQRVIGRVKREERSFGSLLNEVRDVAAAVTIVLVN